MHEYNSGKMKLPFQISNRSALGDGRLFQTVMQGEDGSHDSCVETSCLLHSTVNSNVADELGNSQMPGPSTGCLFKVSGGRGKKATALPN